MTRKKNAKASKKKPSKKQKVEPVPVNTNPQKSPEQNLFEYLQEDLERYTNHMSELYELTKVTTYDEFIKWKESFEQYGKLTKKYLDNFLNGVAEGLTNY